MLEHDIESWAVRKAKDAGWWCRKFKSPAHRSAPDRIFGKGLRVFWVEFKQTGKDPTPLQLEEHGKMREAGLTVYVCDSREGDEFHSKHLAFSDILAKEEGIASGLKISYAADGDAAARRAGRASAIVRPMRRLTLTVAWCLVLAFGCWIEPKHIRTV